MTPTWWDDLLKLMYILSIFGTPLFLIVWAFMDYRRWKRLQEKPKAKPNIEGDIEQCSPLTEFPERAA
jgi:hypothetical protein